MGKKAICPVNLKGNLEAPTTVHRNTRKKDNLCIIIFVSIPSTVEKKAALLFSCGCGNMFFFVNDQILIFVDAKSCCT